MKRAPALAALIAAGGLLAWSLWPADPAAPVADPPTSPRRPVAAVEPPPPIDARTDAGRAVEWLWVIAADTGAPIAGARVSPDDGEVATSDARGAVPFAWPGAELEISAPFMKLRKGVFRPGETIALEPLPSVRGVVLEWVEGPVKARFVAGAEVTTTTPPFTQTVSGADGTFALKASTPNGRVAARKGDRFGVAQFFEGEDEAVIHLEADEATDGLVVDRQGRPLAGVEVAWSAGPFGAQMVTGLDGKWKLPKWDRQVTLSATKEGFLPFLQRPATHPRQQRTARIQLDRPATVTGVVQTPDGRPVAGAALEAGEARAVSGPAGRFTLTGLSPHTRMVEAVLGQRRGLADVTLGEGENPPIVVVLQPELIDVPLRLVDRLGAELRCYTATATPIPAEGWTSDYAPEREALPLRAGRFRIEVTAEHDHVADVTVDVKPPAPLTITVHRDPNAEDEPEPQQLTVRVKTASGVAVGGASVACAHVQGTTREDGTFACTLSPFIERPVRVTAKKGLAAGVASALGPERTLDVVVQPLRTLRGTIAGTLPPGPLLLTVHSAFEGATVPLTGPWFELADRAAVRTILCVVREAERLGCAVAEDASDVTIPVGPPGAFTATVVDEKGDPVEAPTFYVSRQGQTPAAPKGVATVAAPPGTHWVVVNARGTRARAETAVTVRSGETTQVGTLQLK